MALILYDLSNAAGQPMSPYCWRIREALHLLSLPFESRFLSLTEIRQHFTGPNKTVPVLLDGDREIGGSWAIAEYLYEHHDPHKRLFGGEGGYSLAAFATHWVDATVLGRVNRMIVMDIHDSIRSTDRDYYRSREEKRQGRALEVAQAGRESERPELQILLHPARQAIRQQPYIDGSNPTYADFALHSTFQWSRTVSAFEILRPDDRLNEWIGRMDDWLELGS